MKKAASLCRHPTVVGQENATCTEQAEHTQSYLTMVRTNLDALEEIHVSVIHRIADLEKTFLLGREEQF